ncbi:hypothetical protein PXO_06048 [Xanthomonas oryzae pv. oryzae PXO99A]|uniref:Uncharacterized protein n=1 Tax=Xanthomonas oryzae pv. oryzae (strain PXO99A) TaxID=360094 RepID=A0A0K0GQX8_XANOP|nr:hypothetical protein PXO_06048 [Xanthomonas oryzae pv. oryzae PXO99A]
MVIGVTRRPRRQRHREGRPPSCSDQTSDTSPAAHAASTAQRVP